MIKADKTNLDSKKVEEVAKTFDDKKVSNEIKSFQFDYQKMIKERKERLKNRTVKNTVGEYGNFSLEMSLSGIKPRQLVQYWDSYEDHIKKYDEKIENIKASILYKMEVLKNLRKAREEVIEEKNKFNLKDFEPYSWPLKYSDNKELSNKIHDAVKAHEIEYHLGWLIDINKEYDPNINESKKYYNKQPNYELICNDSGNISYLRCASCYKKYILGDKKYKYYSDLNINHLPGSSS